MYIYAAFRLVGATYFDVLQIEVKDVIFKGKDLTARADNFPPICAHMVKAQVPDGGCFNDPGHSVRTAWNWVPYNSRWMGNVSEAYSCVV